MGHLWPWCVVLWDEAPSEVSARLQNMFFQCKTTITLEVRAAPAEMRKVCRTPCYTMNIRCHH